MNIQLIENIDPDFWDQEISNFDTKVMFHQSAWIHFLQETQRGKALRFRITENGNIRGYFVGLIVKKGPIRILGSPLPGWTTDYMGPIVNKGFDSEKFLDSLDVLCNKWNIHHVELRDIYMNSEILCRKEYDLTEEYTYIVPLSTDETIMWKNLKSKSCRYPINKARKNGLIVENTLDATFIEEYYRQLCEVFAKQNLVPTYPLERIRSLVRNLKPKLLFGFQVKYEDEIIATGVFPHDDRCIYFFGGASRMKFHRLYPNELLHWTVMTHAAKLGIKQYDMCGGGSFKPKFGGERVTVYRYLKSYSIAAKFGRKLYKVAFRAKQKLTAKLLR